MITGSSGFIGTNLLESLSPKNYDVAILDRSRNVKFKNKKHYIGDIRDYSFIEKSILDFKPNKVFHLAAYKNRDSSIQEMSLALQVNLIGTLNLCQALTKVSSLDSIITLGTTDEYGNSDTFFDESSIENPISPYGFSKLCSSNLAKYFNLTYGLPIIVLRPTIAYGPHQSNDMFIPSLINTLISNNEFKMTAGHQLRDFIFISDLIDAMLMLSESQNYFGEIFNIGFGKSIMLKDVATSIAKDLNKEIFLKIGSIPYRKNEVFKYETCIKKFKRTFSWEPKVRFDEGIDITINYYKNSV